MTGSELPFGPAVNDDLHNNAGRQKDDKRCCCEPHMPKWKLALERIPQENVMKLIEDRGDDGSNKLRGNHVANCQFLKVPHRV